MKFYETELPEGYKTAYEIDAGNKKVGIIMNLIALVFGIAVGAVLVFAVGWENVKAMFLTNTEVPYTLLYLVIMLVGMVVYMVAHELVHGIAYKILTKQKLTFGLKLSCAYCGVPNIFVYRSAALISLLAPFVVFNIAFLVPFFLLGNTPLRFCFLIWLVVHDGGCVGDLYDTILFLFRFRKRETLMNDTGPKQTIYVKE